MFYTAVRHTHSLVAIILIIGLLLTIIRALISRNAIDLRTRKIAKKTMIVLHIQFLLGIILFFVSPRGFSSISADVMSNSISRFYIIEHPFSAILAVVLVTIGHAKLKKASDEKGAKLILIYYTLGLLLVLSRFPWNSWHLLQLMN